MAKNSCTLNLQDFIPYPVQVLPLREFLPRDSQLTSNPNYNSGTSTTTCPFDCCQKQFQNQYFPNCELTNAPLRMKIGTAGDRHNKVSGIPCLERRTIYEGRVTEMPMRFEDLLKEASNPNADGASNNNQNDHRDHDHSPLNINKPQQPKQQQQSTDSSDNLKLTFHKGGGGKPQEKIQDKNSNSTNNKDQYKYFWDNERSGWTFENIETSTNPRHVPSDSRASGDNDNDTLSQEHQWRQYYGDQRDKRWSQGQLTSLTLHQQQLQEHQRQVIKSDNHRVQSETKAEVTKVSSDFIEQQLSNHLKSFKYIKPSSSPTAGQIGVSNNSPPVGNYRSLNSQSKPNFKPKHQDNLKRALSPRAALEQYERLKKYWDYQHQLLGTSMVPYQNHPSGHLNSQAFSQQPGYPAYHQYGNQWTGGYSNSGASSSHTNQASVSTTGGHQQYQPAGPTYNTWSSEYDRSVDDDQTSQSPKMIKKSIEQIANRDKIRTKAPIHSRSPRVDIEDSKEPKDVDISSNSSRIVDTKSPTLKKQNQNIGVIRDPNVPNLSKATTLSAMEIEDSPKDLSVGRRNSDQSSSSGSPPERSVSTGLIDGYDHIVLLDKRVKSYMCKRCFETLKSEQEIRNHLFCKMLNDTVQCHICRNLFSTEEYTEHLKLHAVKNH